MGRGQTAAHKPLFQCPIGRWLATISLAATLQDRQLTVNVSAFGSAFSGPTMIEMSVTVSSGPVSLGTVHWRFTPELKLSVTDSQ
jgi:hypothetical protein